ncbi:MAG TPA: PRC-barrel domain-containing protein, partial [Acidimicrobiia bacterium]
MQTMTRQDLNAMVGRTLVGPGGEKIGKVADVYLDERTKQPEWLAVSTGLFGTKVSFVPLSGVRRRTGDASAAPVYESPFDKERVKGAPTAEADGALSQAEEDHLYRYYQDTRPASGPAAAG